jgi:hypothetical protein
MQHATGETSRISSDTGDVQSTSTTILSDDELAEHGLVNIQAFVRATSLPTSSATRAKRMRDVAASAGAKQLNVVVPLQAHTTMRDIAKSLQAGSLLTDVLRVALTGELRKTDPSAMVQVITNSETIKGKSENKKVSYFGALKSWLFRLFWTRSGRTDRI